MLARQTSVCLERCGASYLQIQEIWPLDATAAQLSLDPNPGTNHVLAGCFGVPLSECTCNTEPCWWPSPGGGGRVTATASFSSDCGIDHPSHGAFYDWWSHFSVTAAWAWNSLPLSVTSSASHPVFWKRLKTALFTRSFPSYQHFSTLYIVTLLYSAVVHVFYYVF